MDYEVLKGKEQFKVLSRLLKYFIPHLKSLISIFFVIIIATGFDLSGPLIIKQMTDNYLVVNNIVMSSIIRLIGLYFLSLIGFAIFKYVQLYLINKVGYKIVQQIRVDVYAKLQTLGMRYFDQTPAGSIVSRVTNDTDAIQDMFNNVLAVVVSSTITLIGIICTMMMIDWQIALFCFSLLPIILLVIFLYQKYSTIYYQLLREKLSQLNTKLAESISGMNIIQEFNQQDRLVDEFSETNQEHYIAGMKNLKIDGLLLYPIIHLLTAFAIAAMLSFFGFRALNSTITIGSIMVFVQYIYMFFNPLYQIMERLSIYQQAIVAGSRVFTIMDHQELAPQQTPIEGAKIKDAKIEFKNVTFSYDNKTEVLSNISFTVNPGETVALVGHTGSGKSSIINLIMRFYEFFEGDILIDDVSIKNYPIEHLRKMMGLVLQDPFLYYGTIKDNVRLQNDTITDEEIIEACKFVQADSFIEELDDKYNHLVIERGAAFSTGQKQLLAFARTIATNPKILILDEATANIDTETETLIQNGLEKMRKGRTTIAIAHRLSTIKDANLILVLSKGKIVEQGTHESLLEQKGIYYNMYQLQQQEAMDK